ncbi:SGNH hydrolase-type esterase domain-containing protein, partial [Lophiotrema nucula]
MASHILILLGVSFFTVGISALPRSTSHNVRQEDLDPDDQSWIQNWAAVGDSYASGIGAGNNIDYSCSRYDNAYPNLINNDERLSGQQIFEFKACSGAVTNDVAKQVDALSSNQDAITVSSGGNDALLVSLLNECIYGWLISFSNCDKAIASSKNAITNDLPARLDNLYSKTKGKLSSQGAAYITGYSRFFDETTNECDSVTFWMILIPFAHREYLTQARRQQLNGLVDMMNSALRDAVSRAGDQFIFVEYDSPFGDFEGRYCEPGVKEPAPNRADLLFY